MRNVCPLKLLVEIGHPFSTLTSALVRLKYPLTSTNPEMCSYYTGFQLILIPQASVSDALGVRIV